MGQGQSTDVAQTEPSSLPESLPDLSVERQRVETPPPPSEKPPEPLGRPEFLPDPVNRPDIKITQKGFFKERQSKEIAPHLTFTLPKGTLLFRGIRDEPSKAGDFQGVPEKGDTPLRPSSSRCLAPYYQAFFYPYPYVIDTVVGVGATAQTMMVYVTTQDIEIVCLVHPSNLTRDSLDKNIVKRCRKIEDYGCKLTGSRDPCLTEVYSKTFPDVTGILALEGVDVEEQNTFLDDPDHVNKAFVRYMGTQVGMITDSTQRFDERKPLQGVPEIILRPMSRSLKTSYTTPNGKLAEFVELNKDVLNYKELAALPRRPGDETGIEDFMKRILSLGGYNGYHAAIDKQTGFYRVKELSAPFESTATVVRKNEPAFVFRRNPDFTEMYGRSRRKTRRAKKSRRN